MAGRRRNGEILLWFYADTIFWIRYYYELPLEEAPRKFSFGRVDATLIDVLTGTLHGEPWDIRRLFRTSEWDDVRAYAAFGTRLVGWMDREKLPLERSASSLVPLRYSVGGDIEAICEALQRLSKGDLRKNTEYMVEQNPVFEEEGSAAWLREQVAENVLPNLRQFYETASKEGEIVIHDMR